MKIRRTLATAVALAVTTPVVLLAASPAFADTTATSTSTSASSSTPSIEELEKAVAAAKKAYDDAVAAEAAARQVLEAELSDTAPLAVAAAEAKKQAEAAAAAKTAADDAVVVAQAAVDAVMADPNATDDERVAALRAVVEAKKQAEAAAAAKTAADTKYADADKARDDARVDAARKYDVVKKALKAAEAALKAAEKALADAKEDAGTDECVAEPDLGVSVSGLPGKIAAGTKVVFSMRLTNHTGQTLDEVYPYASVHATDTTGMKDLDHLLKLQWSTTASPAWKNLDKDGYADTISPLKAGAHADVKLRLTVDAAAPAGEGVAFTAGDYLNDDGSCGGTPDLSAYEFELVAAGTESGGTAKPGTTPRTSGSKPQGGTSTVPVSTTTTSTGTLAQTGSSSALPQLALAGGIAVALGAGAVVVTRRRTSRSA